jgi:hypothetical protein
MSDRDTLNDCPMKMEVFASHHAADQPFAERRSQPLVEYERQKII